MMKHEAISQAEMKPWQIEKYLKKLCLDFNPEPTLENLKQLQYNHLLHIPYENLDSMQHKITSLEHDELFNKMIGNKRGGICFELNGLYNWLLEALGYELTSFAARFISEKEEIEMRRHRVICVMLDQTRRYLTDVGVNSESPRLPLLMKENLVQTDGISAYKLTRDPFWGWLLWQKEIDDVWKRLYGFTEEPQLDMDFIMPTIFCDLHSMSPINKINKISIFTPDTNITVRGNRLKYYQAGKVQQVTEIRDNVQLQKILCEYFQIDIPVGELIL